MPIPKLTSTLTTIADARTFFSLLPPLPSGPWCRLSSRIDRLYTELTPLSHSLSPSPSPPSPQLDGSFFALTTALFEATLHARRFAALPPPLQAAAQREEEGKATELHARIDALMTDIAVQLNAMALTRGEQEQEQEEEEEEQRGGGRRGGAAEELKEGGGGHGRGERDGQLQGRGRSKGEQERRLLLDLMQRVVEQRVDETGRLTNAQLNALRRAHLAREGRSDDAERLEEERRATRPLLERLDGLPIIPHTELKLHADTRSGQLGRGAFGTVVKGCWLRQGRLPVAVKLPLRLDTDPVERARFEEEVVLLHRLRGSPNVVTVLAVCLEAGHECIVMQLLRGGNLFERLKRARREPAVHGLTWTQKVGLAMDIVRGVNALHLLPPPLGPVLHRDLKSLNVLLDEHGRACITDFGLSRVEYRGEAVDFVTLAPNRMSGTAHWRAPEQQLVGQKARFNARCDVFSLGMVLWELATEQPPFANKGQAEVGDLILRGVRPVIPDSVPAYYSEWVTRCWEQDADKRPLCAPLLDEMQQVADALRMEKAEADAYAARQAAARMALLSGKSAITTAGTTTSSISTGLSSLHLQPAAPPSTSPTSSPFTFSPRTPTRPCPTSPNPSTSHPPPLPSLLLPSRARHGQALRFRGFFHESGGVAVRFRMRLKLLSAWDPPCVAMGEGRHKDRGRFEVGGAFQVQGGGEEEGGKEGGGEGEGMRWKLRVKAKVSWGVGRPTRTVVVSCEQRDAFSFSGYWKEDGHTSSADAVRGGAGGGVTSPSRERYVTFEEDGSNDTDEEFERKW